MLGACNVGYDGVLCQDCEVGYSRSGTNYKCSKCPPPNLNSLRLFGLSVVLMLVLLFLIRSNLYSAAKQKNQVSVLLRIMMNHFQLLTLTASFDLEWPTQLRSFFQSLMPISEVSTQFLSLDCFLDTRKKTSDMQDSYSGESQMFRIFFQKLIILAFSPMIIFAACFVVWQVIFKF